MQRTLSNKQEIIKELEAHGYVCEDYRLGIKVWMNVYHPWHYINISRQPNYELTLDVRRADKLDPDSLSLLEDHGRIRATSLIAVLNSIKRNF